MAKGRQSHGKGPAIAWQAAGNRMANDNGIPNRLGNTIPSGWEFDSQRLGI